MRNKTLKLLLFCIFIIPSLLLADNTAEVNIYHPRVDGNYFKFDIQIKRTSTWDPGFVYENRMGNADFYFDYNEFAFFGNPSYENLHTQLNNANYNCYATLIGNKLVFEVYYVYYFVNIWLEAHTDYVSLCTMTWEIADNSENSGLIWFESATGINSIQPNGIIIEAFNGSGDISLEEPTPLILSSFSAAYAAENLTLCWSTHSEANNMGWNIYRGYSEDAILNDETIMVNSCLIPGAGTTTEPTDYVFIDERYHYLVSESTYWYWLESVDNSGITEMYGPISIKIQLPGEDEPYNPDMQIYGLYNYPNPFYPNTSINFRIKEDSFGELSIYNVKGEKITSIFRDNIEEGDLITRTWNGRDETGKRVASGIYFYTLKTGDKIYTKKMILQK